MNLLGLIKEKLTDSLIEKVSIFLGESPENINTALERVLPAIFGVIILDTNAKLSVAKLMDVLQDGGHTGEILDDLPGLLDDFEKTQLLISIGSNIFNHFYGNKSNGIFETIATLSDIRKTSASSLIGLSTPLVLGALGKVVDEEGMNVSALMKFLNEQRESVIVSLPPVLINKLIDREDGTAKKTNRGKTKVSYDNRPKSSGGSSWIPWVVLVIVLAAIVFYLFKYKEQTEPKFQAGLSSFADSTITIIPDTSDINGFEDSTVVLSPADTVFSKPDEKLTPIAGNSESSMVLFSNELLNSNSWIVIPGLSFKNGVADIKNTGAVSDLAVFLKNNPRVTATIAGGSQSISGTLGKDRAAAVQKLLSEKGIQTSRISIQPKAVNESNAEVIIKIAR